MTAKPPIVTRHPDGSAQELVSKILGHKHLSNWNDYAFDCPEGTWTGRLEQLTWGKSTNLILCFADVATGKQYRLSVFSGTGYKPRDGSHDFRHDATPGDVFELTPYRGRKTDLSPV